LPGFHGRLGRHVNYGYVAAAPSQRSLRQMRINRVLGLILVAIATLGYLTVADDLRHTGEFLGVTSILLAGALLLLTGLSARAPSVTLSRSLAAGIVLGIPIGAVLDAMLLGLGIGIAIGVMLELVRVWLQRRRATNVP